MKQIWLVMLAAIACSGARTPSGAAPPASTQTVKVAVGPQETVDITRVNDVRALELSASRDRVWTALMAAHDAIGTTPSVVDAGAGSASFLHQNSRRLMGRPISAYVDCGRSTSGARADVYNVTIRVQQVVRAQGSAATTLYTVLSAWARPMGMAGDAVQCFTVGTLEKKIAEIVQLRLQS
jgi:hypothetical protein